MGTLEGKFAGWLEAGAVAIHDKECPAPGEGFEDLARVLPTGELSAEKIVITAQRHARILQLIDTLPPREREVLLLSAVKELSTVEIASVLETTESTIRSRLYRARHALATLLEQEGNLP